MPSPLNYKKIQPQNLKKKRKKILTYLALTTFLFGIVGFYGFESATGIKGLNNTLALFFGEWDDNRYWLVDVAKLFGILTFSFGLFIMFFSKYFNQWHIKSVQKTPYTLIVGLSEQNVSFLKSEYNRDSTIIIEKDKNHKYLEYFQERDFATIIGHTKKAIENLDLDKMERCIISTENDRKNIALGKFLMNEIENSEDKSQTVHVCIQNRDLNVLFKQDVIAKEEESHVDILTYSIYENMVKKLFSEHGILGNMSDIIERDDDFAIILVGDSDLAIELVYHISFLSTLPNENRLTLYLLGANSNKFQDKIKKLFPKIEKIPHLTIEAKEINSESLAFYEDKVWESENLTNIMIATRDEEKNLDIAINLQDTTYIREIGHKRFKTKVLFALYHNLGLGEEIDKNDKAFKNFYTFGNIRNTSTKEILIDEKLDLIAKLIQNDYKGEKDVLQKILKSNWLETPPHEQDANKTQAIHIDIKLLAFGLKRVQSEKSLSELLEINRKLFDTRLEDSNKIKAKLENYKVADFPISFETLFDKVARSEHNRWNAFHYLNGWEYRSELNKDAKEHNCLQPLENFDNNDIKNTYQYDMASVYYIPEYLARSGFEVLGD
ncbi:hypothetical protein MNB_SV-14-1318 [hydrothermal vent metagenome]|uniref:Ryanodine receptor Ryr domain-containing protein n=1 Tax=hydrothermal vent metagenome TaxID=652676 RepID=A0A1W1BW60_9ZZZZ